MTSWGALFGIGVFVIFLAVLVVAGTLMWAAAAVIARVRASRGTRPQPGQPDRLPVPGDDDLDEYARAWHRLDGA